MLGISANLSILPRSIEVDNSLALLVTQAILLSNPRFADQLRSHQRRDRHLQLDGC